ncbi:MAG: AraC family transcriptional regulator [Porticoccaceae bacterium]|nr:AraC family transcriptional regulator [Porticoccaceae bacterium]
MLTGVCLPVLADVVPEQEAITPPTEEAAAEPQSVADLTQSVQELNRDLLILEEELLFPTHTQVAVFVSMDVGHYFRLDSVKLKIDDDMVASYLYTDQQAQALYQGGVQRLYLGNIKSGDHEISAFFTGEGPNGRAYKRGATVTLNKGTDAKQLELKITDSSAKQQPEFEIREW